ncbi:MAG: hypothetical protein ACJAUQ_000417 [Maribacter sp.]|jgi:hypothetical protein
MKKLLSLLAIVAIIFSTYCSKIEENNDPIIGIWIEAASVQDSSIAKKTIRKEWIFNDVYLGRYHRWSQGTIIEQTDFEWSQDGGTYTVEYRALKNKENDIITIKTNSNGTLLQQINGDIFAIRK